MTLTFLDYALLGVVAFSTLFALWRGVLAEAMALVGWFVAFWLARTFSHQLAVLLPEGVGNDMLRWLLAFVLLLVAAWTGLRMLRALLVKMISLIGLGAIDNVLGGVFGLARGLLLATLMVLIGGMTDMPQSDMWRYSVAVGPFESFATAFKPWLPDSLAQKVNFHRKPVSLDSLTLPIRPAMQGK